MPMHSRWLATAPLSAAVLLVSALTAWSADDSGAYAVDGVGSRTCADLSKAFETRDDRLLGAFAAWTDGFMTGYNVHSAQTFDITPWQTVELTLTKMNVFCKDNPQTAFVEALGKLIAVLREGRLLQADALVLLRSGKQGVYMYRTMIPRLKAALQAEGFAVASPDGAFDDAMAIALKGFQRREGIAESGLPDQPTLNALLK